MSSSENLFKAVLNRLAVRLGAKVFNTASEIAVATQDAPKRLKKEWEVLKDEIIAEANRLDDESNQADMEHAPEMNNDDMKNASANNKSDQTKSQIANLRLFVKELTRELEDKN